MTRYDFLESADIFGNSVIIHNNSFGVYNTYADKEIIPPIYEELYILSNDLFAIRKGNFWGVIDSKNESVAYPKFENVSTFDDNFVTLNFSCDRLGLISKQNPCHKTAFFYSGISDFNNGFSIVMRNGLYGVINKNLVEIIPAKYQSILWYKDDLFFTQTKDKVLLINSKNKTLKTFDYTSIWPDRQLPFYLFTIESSTSAFAMGLLDSNLNEIIPAKYQTIIPCSYNRFVVKLSNNYGVLSNDGKKVIDFNYSFIHTMENGFFVCCSNDFEISLFDTNGNYITCLNYVDIKPVGLGFAIKRNSKWGVMDSNFNLVSDIIYDSVDSIWECTKTGKNIATVTYLGRDGSFCW